MDDFFSGGARLCEERQRFGLNQEDFANVCGVGKRAQCYYEAGERMPDAAYLARASAFGIDVLYVLTGTRAHPLSFPASELARADGESSKQALDHPTASAAGDDKVGAKNKREEAVLGLFRGLSVEEQEKAIRVFAAMAEPKDVTKPAKKRA
ncbi:MAG: helix-turn-helix transcriptional regulator [Alphaproteobacteria bacterium]|nr:helix-turn-helix transcriptional regulator [Alphaproteobacteria bacterium]